MIIKIGKDFTEQEIKAIKYGIYYPPQYCEKCKKQITMAQKTAVDFLIDKLETEAITDYSFDQAHKVITLDVYTFNKLFEQAKQMEKEQIIDAYIDGSYTGCGCYEYMDGNDADQYYNEKYKK